MILAQGADKVASRPLAQASEQNSFMVDRVSGPEQRRLCELGLVEGARLEVLNRSRGGMLVVKVGGSRLGMASGMADCVWVK